MMINTITSSTASHYRSRLRRRSNSSRPSLATATDTDNRKRKTTPSNPELKYHIPINCLSYHRSTESFDSTTYLSSKHHPTFNAPNSENEQKQQPTTPIWVEKYPNIVPISMHLPKLKTKRRNKILQTLIFLYLVPSPCTSSSDVQR